MKKMEKINIYDFMLKERESMEIPNLFKLKPRLDLIKKATEVQFSNNKQPQGRDKRAGLKNTAEGWGTGHGLSRAPRLKGSGYPTARNVGRVPFAVGGRRTHPIKTEKRIKKRINKKSRTLSLISAISASADKYWIEKRGHDISKIPQLPFVIDDKIQTIKKTKKLYSVLSNLGLEKDLIRVKSSKKVRAGKGKKRGRKYKRSKGFLIIIKDNFGILQASKNIPGVDVVNIEHLSISDIAPGGVPGRLIIWTASAFKELKKFEGEDF